MATTQKFCIAVLLLLVLICSHGGVEQVSGKLCNLQIGKLKQCNNEIKNAAKNTNDSGNQSPDAPGGDASTDAPADTPAEAPAADSPDEAPPADASAGDNSASAADNSAAGAASEADNSAAGAASAADNSAAGAASAADNSAAGAASAADHSAAGADAPAGEASAGLTLADDAEADADPGSDDSTNSAHSDCCQKAMEADIGCLCSFFSQRAVTILHVVENFVNKLLDMCDIKLKGCT